MGWKDIKFELKVVRKKVADKVDTLFVKDKFTHKTSIEKDINDIKYNDEHEWCYELGDSPVKSPKIL